MGQSQGSSGKGQKPATPSYGSMGGGSKNTNMQKPNQNMMGQRKPMSTGMGTTGVSANGIGAGGYTDAQKKILTDSGMGRANWDDTSHQTDGGPTGAKLMEQMNTMTDPGQQYAFFAKNAGMGRGGNDLQSQLMAREGGLEGMNRWINNNHYGAGSAYDQTKVPVAWGQKADQTPQWAKEARAQALQNAGLPPEPEVAETVAAPPTPTAPVDPNAAVPMQKRRTARTRQANPQALAQLMQQGY